MNKYTLYARIIPTLICSIPALLFQYFFLDQEIANFIGFLGNLEFIGDITLSIAIIYGLSQVNRLIAKIFFEQEEAYMPTTNFLLFSNSEYTKDHKQKIYKKIQKDFDIQLPSEKEQNKNELKSRKQIAEAMSLVRRKVGSGKLLLQHNIEYGFWRNFIGSTLFAIFFSITDFYLAFSQSKNSIFNLSIVLLFVYLVPLIFHKNIIRKVGYLYAKVLIQEYLGMN